MQSTAKKGKEPNIDNIINKAVNIAVKKAVKEAYESGRLQAEQRPKNAYKATERRLYALSDLKEKVQKDREYLEQLQTYGLPGHSTDLVRFKKSGVRLDDADIKEALIQDIIARIAANEHEIKLIEEALAPLTSDLYYLTVSGKYFEHLSDDEIAEKIPCDSTTVWRNRTRLVQRIAVRLFGADAI